MLAFKYFLDGHVILSSLHLMTFQRLSMAGLDPATQALPQLRLLGHWLKADDGES
jgi:hypothetical protein